MYNNNKNNRDDCPSCFIEFFFGLMLTILVPLAIINAIINGL